MWHCSSGHREIDPQILPQLVRHISAGRALLEDNQLEKAESEFLHAITLAPENASGYANLALVYLDMAQFDKAEEMVHKALDLTPDDPALYLVLAEIYEFSNHEHEALSQLKKALKINPDYPRALYKFAQISKTIGGKKSLDQQKDAFTRLVAAAPANIVARISLIELLIRSAELDRALAHLEQLRSQFAELPQNSAPFYQSCLESLRAGNVENARNQSMILHNTLKIIPLYQANLRELLGPDGLKYSVPFFALNLRRTRDTLPERPRLNAISFTEMTGTAGLKFSENFSKAAKPVITAGDFDDDGQIDIFYAGGAGVKLLRNQNGHFNNEAIKRGINISGQVKAARFLDFDNNKTLDLFVSTSAGNLLLSNAGNGQFSSLPLPRALRDLPVKFILAADFDHEGDLDFVLITPNGLRAFRNNLDSSFTDVSESTGFAKLTKNYRDAYLGDFDDDGDLDIFCTAPDGEHALLSNLRQGQFADVGSDFHLTTSAGAVASAVADFNNDGRLDIFTAGAGAANRLFLGGQTPPFIDYTDTSLAALPSMNLAVTTAQIIDFDNDGFTDLCLATADSSQGVFLLHNDGTGIFTKFKSVSTKSVHRLDKIISADFDNDGDADILATAGAGGLQLLRNDGGNLNNYLVVKLAAQTIGSGKNNAHAIGARIEIRAGDFYSMQTVTEPVSLIGLGPWEKVDVMRITWPNGSSQNHFDVQSRTTIVEKQVLKGSCPFIYTWNGERFVFVTDIMWRSALGMPLGIMGGEKAFAASHSTNEYVKIFGEYLQEKDDKFTIQITEELWESAYLDKSRLIVVDHPDSIDIFVDEKFTPLPAPPLQIYGTSGKIFPRHAVDENGVDHLPGLLEHDFNYVDNLRPAAYQGQTEWHDLVLDFGKMSIQGKKYLYLTGWIFPGDASINVATSQNDHAKATPPRLQMRNAEGKWQTVMPNIWFPSGKNKTMVVELTGKFLTEDHSIRLQTNMQIYWDQIFMTSTSNDALPTRLTRLEPIAADLHYRGFSREFRKGGRHGPHWFDYDEVSQVAKWRDLTGTYTRFGDVLPLLKSSDDFYVTLNAGDEVTLSFDALAAPQLPVGWRRDFLLFSDGWVKDGDLNTATGQKLAPLPFHAMTQYPYGPEETYPVDEAHQEFLRKYMTRKVTTAPFTTQLLTKDE